jgi:hypothetical protein
MAGQIRAVREPTTDSEAAGSRGETGRAMKLKRFFRTTVARAVTLLRRSIAKASNTSGTFYCSVCRNRIRRFLPHGDPERANVRCPVCGSLGRHRLDWMFLATRTDLFDQRSKKMLHKHQKNSCLRSFARSTGWTT